MKKILVTVSFSPDSMNAARYAADMAAAIGAELCLFHVLQIPVSVAEIPITDSVYEGMEETGLKWLNELQEELQKRTEGKIKISSDMNAGSISYRISEQCNAEKPFVVIMGVSGNPIDHFFTGNTPLYAIRNLPYPLLVVPENAIFHPLKKVVLACDPGDLANGLPGSFMDEWKEVFGSQFELLNISTARENREMGKTFDFGSWKERMKEIYPALHIVEVDRDHVEEGVSRYLQSSGADLVIVFPKRHGFFEFHRSHSKRIVRESVLPVLALHP